jgi:hypothetical protein
MVGTAIIGFADALSAPEVAWSLADGGMRLAAFARKGRRTALHWSRHIEVFDIAPPEVDFGRSGRDLQAALDGLCERACGAALVLMPLDDAAVWLCSKLSLKGRATLAGPTGDATLLALDKKRQIQLAQESGFAVPQTRYIGRFADLPTDDIGFPIVFKPSRAVSERDGKLGKGKSWICLDRTELQSASSDWGEREPMLLQEFIQGTGEGLFGLATQQEVVGWTAHRRLRMMNPHGSGSSACVIERVDESLKVAAERFLKQCSWKGLFMVELLADKEGKKWFMEFNGRPWGSMALARRMGFEYPAWSVEAALGLAPSIAPPVGAREPILCRHLGRELLHLAFVARGPESRALRQWPSLCKALRDVVRLGRHDRWYNWRADDCGVFFADFCYTLRDNLLKRHH